MSANTLPCSSLADLVVNGGDGIADMVDDEEGFRAYQLANDEWWVETPETARLTVRRPTEEEKLLIAKHLFKRRAHGS